MTHRAEPPIEAQPLEPQWTPTRAMGRGVLLIGVLVLIGVLLGRPDLVAIAAPFAVGAALALRRRPWGGPPGGLGPAARPIPGWSALVALHHSRRPGEGGELAGVRRYSPGDRLRRVDWRVTLRTREPHVGATWSDRDATVVLLLDVSRDAGISGGIQGSASMVDTTVRAAAAITEHYLRQGDRVGLVEQAEAYRHLPARHGRRPLQSALDWLRHGGAAAHRVRPRGASGGCVWDDAEFVLDSYRFPPSALVIVLTPLLGPAIGAVMATLARAGRLVVAVVTLV